MSLLASSSPCKSPSHSSTEFLCFYSISGISASNVSFKVNNNKAYDEGGLLRVGGVAVAVLGAFADHFEPSSDLA